MQKGAKMKPVAMLIALLMMGFTFAADDGPLSRVADHFSILAEDMDEASVEQSAWTVTLSYKTRKFMVHSSDKLGRHSEKAHETIGPRYDGLIVQVTMQDGQYFGAAMIPQNLWQPYWTTFVNAYPVNKGNRHLHVNISYGSRADHKTIEKIKDMLNSMIDDDPDAKAVRTNSDDDAYLFTSFRKNGEDGLHLAYSRDGLKWTALKGGKPFLEPMVGGKLMRDPCIIKGPDSLFHMVWTTSWEDKGIGIAHSEDLINWSDQEFVPVMEHEPKARNCWAPEITWDPDGRQYVIYWATTLPDRFTETAASADKGWNHRMYCTTTRDFKSYTKTRLFYNPGFNVIDSTIVRVCNQYVMITKDETRHPPAKNLHIATSDKATGPWSHVNEPFTPQGLWVEGPTVLKIGDHWYVYYDCYTMHRYGAMKTGDFKTWEDVSGRLTVPEGMRHGSALAVSQDVLDGLLKQK